VEIQIDGDCGIWGFYPHLVLFWGDWYLHLIWRELVTPFVATVKDSHLLVWALGEGHTHLVFLCLFAWLFFFVWCSCVRFNRKNAMSIPSESPLEKILQGSQLEQ
jgi:hypothetical protein